MIEQTLNKRIVRITAAVMTTLLILALLLQFRIVAVYLLLSLAVAAALRPSVSRVVGRPLLVRVGWTLLYLLVVGGSAFLLFLAVVEAINEVRRMVEVVSAQEAWGSPLQVGGRSFPGALLGRLPTPKSLFGTIVDNLQKTVLPRLLDLTQGLVGFITGTAITLFLSIYWIASQDHFERLWLSVIPSGRRNRARTIWRSIETAVGTYIRSQITQSLLFGVLLGSGFWALGSRFPVLLAIIGAVTRFVPVVGVMLALAITLLVGLLASSQLGLLMFIFLLAILFALEVWVRPRLFPNPWNNIILVLVLVIVMAEVAGLVGLIIAPALAVLAQILWTYLFQRTPEPVGPVAKISEMKERYQRLRESIEAMEEPPPPVVATSLEQLTQLMEKAEPVLSEAFPPESRSEEPVPAAPQL